MPFSLRVFVTFLGLLSPLVAAAQTDAGPRLHIELNTVQDTGAACRLTFVAENAAGTAVDQAVFETVVFNKTGSVVSLSLFDFRALPADIPRVRQFDLPGVACATLGKVLINGTSTCVVAGIESDLCEGVLSLGSRIEVELLG